jgi:hypothetical protein
LGAAEKANLIFNDNCRSKMKPGIKLTGCCPGLTIYREGIQFLERSEATQGH